MADNFHSKAYIKGSEELESELQHWDIPDVSNPAADELGTNVFGQKANQPQEIKEEAQAVAPPTLAEIEEIRAQAEQEGLEQGRNQGFKEGLEKGRLQGLEEGHGEGFVQGVAQGVEQGLAQAQEMVIRFESLVEQFTLPMSILDTQVEQELLAMVSVLTKSLIGHELQTHPEHILAAIRNGIDALPSKEQAISIRLHPDDAILVESLYGQAQLERKQWQLDADPALVRGDCVIESHKSQVDMRLETRLEQVFSQLDKQQERLSAQVHQQEQELAAHKQNLRQQSTDDSAATSQEADANMPEQDAGVSDNQPLGDADANSPTPTAE